MYLVFPFCYIRTIIICFIISYIILLLSAFGVVESVFTVIRCFISIVCFIGIFSLICVFILMSGYLALNRLAGTFVLVTLAPSWVWVTVVTISCTKG